MLKKNKYIFLFLVAAFGMTACKKWDDHIKVTNQDLNQNLLEAISSNNDLGTFREFISKSGLDSVLTSSRTFTVWAPTNAALQGVDPAIVNDTARLKAFVLNHISNQSYFTRSAQSGLRVPMLNGKYNNFSMSKFDEANITIPDRFYSNGVLHVIDKSIPVLPSLWEYINSNSQFDQNAFIASLDYTEFDPDQATIDSISSTTGLPIYKPGTGLVLRNKFNDRVYNLKKEDRQFTYFVLDNAAFALESDSLDTYFKTGSTTSTDSLSNWNTVKDLVIEGSYAANNLPASFISASGVQVPLSAAFIVQTVKLSNAIVHVMSKVDVPNQNKFSQITIQGEQPSGFLSDKRGNTNYRVRFNPVTGENYNDIMISGHGVSGYYAFYRLYEMPSIKYKVYSMATNDFQTNAFTQNIVAKWLSQSGSYTTLGTLPQAVPVKTAPTAYTEMYLGEFTLTTYGTLDMQLTASGTNPLVLDYLRLVPVP